ncbi:MAG: YybS family protein [Tissierellaceae bacterium]|nr:YybS family protein [Tissierellaceae bacterium]
MNENKTNMSSYESIILAIIMSIYIAFSIYYFPPLLMITPVPFIIYGIKTDLKSALLSLVATLLTIGIIFEPLSSLLLFLVYGPFIAMNIYLIHKRYKAIKVVLYSASILFVSITLLFGLLKIGGYDLVSQLEENFSQTLSVQMDMLKEMGFTSYELLETRDSLRSNFETVLMIFPSVIFISIYIGSYINYLLTTFGLRKTGISILNLPSFSRFRLPDNFTTGSLIMILTGFFMRWMNISYADSIYVNIMILLGVTLFIQGFSVIHYFLLKIKTKKFLRVLTYIILIFSPHIFSGISILGGVDVIFDLRKFKRAKS